MGKTFCASDYGGPGDPTSGTHGYHGDNLTGRMAFAELGMGTLLGGLPYKAKVKIEYGGKSVIAEKLDIGLGGPGCGGHTRGIDLWYQTAQALGFSGLAPVTVTLPGEPGAPAQDGKIENAAFVVPSQPALEPLLEFFKGGGGGLTPGNPFSGLSSLAEGFKHLFDVITFLSSASGWIRIGKVLLGVFLLLTGVLGMANISVTEQVITGGKKAAEVAAVAAVAA